MAGNLCNSSFKKISAVTSFVLIVFGELKPFMHNRKSESSTRKLHLSASFSDIKLDSAPLSFNTRIFSLFGKIVENVGSILPENPDED